MSQHDGTIANDTRTAVRGDIENAIKAAFSTHKGPNAPSPAYAGQLWIDDNTPSSSVWTLFVHDGSDWISIGTIDTTSNTFVLKNGVPLAGSGGAGGAYYFTGQVLWGQNSTTTPGSGNTTTGAGVGSDGSAHFSNDGSYVALMNRNSDGTVLACNRSGTNVGSIGVTGSGASFNTSSDYRLKFDVEAVDPAEAEAIVKALRPVRHKWVRDPNGASVFGFIAHEYAEQLPQGVTGAKDAVDADGNIAPQQMDKSTAVPVLAAALKSALAKIEAVEARASALEARVAALEPHG
ncbi:MAG: tail fiber domain-containing protein [Reyranellaceae bacterium]